jgi:hypothetical protein
MRISFPSEQNPESLFLEIMTTEYGVKAIALPRYFAKTPFVFLLVSLLKSAILFVKDIAKTPFVRVFFPLMKSYRTPPFWQSRG